jgi:hypothetical protein
VAIITWAGRKGKGGGSRMEDNMIEAVVRCPYILRPFGLLKPKGSLLSGASRLYPNPPAATGEIGVSPSLFAHSFTLWYDMRRENR